MAALRDMMGETSLPETPEQAEQTELATMVCAWAAAALATIRNGGKGRVHTAHEHARAHKLEPRGGTTT